ncbi:hypothetical protein DID77_00535 [Candidatus Marinamargulisbacteria bacterium SCGC AG-439-L15]|nr:hypothetical protein DID77_00535 [Candidatus Marinamargulisbacteria bacterium SCGC AG-439-L15]
MINLLRKVIPVSQQELKLLSEVDIPGFPFFSRQSSSFMMPAIALSKKIDGLDWTDAIENAECLVSWKILLIDSMAGPYEEFLRSVKSIEDVPFLEDASSLYGHFVRDILNQKKIDNVYAKKLGFCLATLFEQKERLRFTKSQEQAFFALPAQVKVRALSGGTSSFDGYYQHSRAAFKKRIDPHSVTDSDCVDIVDNCIILPCRAELTFYDIVWGMIQTPPVWPLGLVPSHLKADGQRYGVLDFYKHDLTHLRTCYQLMMEKKGDDVYSVSKDYLVFSKGFRVGLTQSLEDKDFERYDFYQDVMAAAFLFMHEDPPRQETSSESIQRIGDDVSFDDFNIRRFFSQDNLYDLLPGRIKALVDTAFPEDSPRDKREALRSIAQSFRDPAAQTTKAVATIFAQVIDWRELAIRNMKSCFPVFESEFVDGE